MFGKFSKSQLLNRKYFPVLFKTFYASEVSAATIYMQSGKFMIF